MKTKDETIIFQNQSKLVQEWFKECKICPDLMDINLGTDLQVRWITEGYSAELKDRYDKYQKYIDNKYKG